MWNVGNTREMCNLQWFCFWNRMRNKRLWQALGQNPKLPHGGRLGTSSRVLAFDLWAHKPMSFQAFFSSSWIILYFILFSPWYLILSEVKILPLLPFMITEGITIVFRMVSTFWAVSPFSLCNTSFRCLFISTSSAMFHSNIGVWSRITTT